MGKALCMLVVLVSLMFTQGTLAESAVYEISKGKQKLFLAGTIHLLRSQDFPLPAEYDAAYKQSQKIVLEADMQQAQNPEFGQRLARAMILPDNKTLKDVLTLDNWTALQVYAAKNQYPLSETMMFNAVMTSIIIVMNEAKKMGVGEGADAFFSKAAIADKKSLAALETSDEIIGYMKKMGNEDPNKTIEATLKDVENMPGDIGKMISSWKAGDLEEMDRFFGERMRKETPELYQSLLVERNQKWQPQIEQMLQTPEVELVLVGSLHLAGKDGLLKQLKKSGYKVKPYSL